MTVKDAEEVLRYQNEATLFFTAVGGTQDKGDALFELPPVDGLLEPGVSRVFPRCFPGVSRVFPRCFPGVSEHFFLHTLDFAKNNLHNFC